MVRGRHTSCQHPPRRTVQGTVAKVVLILAMAVPFAVVGVWLPRLAEFGAPASSGDPGGNLSTSAAASPPGTGGQADATGTPLTGRRFSPLGAEPPPTLAVPTRIAPGPNATPAPPGLAQRDLVVVANTDRRGAVLRAEPVSGRSVAALREGDPLLVAERRAVNGVEWLRVRTPAGADGWVAAIVTRPMDQGARAAAAAAFGPLAAPATPGAAGATPTGVAATGRTHTVQPGDELRKIAAANGVSMAAIMAINDIPDPDNLRVGQVLAIPKP